MDPGTFLKGEASRWPWTSGVDTLIVDVKSKLFVRNFAFERIQACYKKQRRTAKVSTRWYGTFLSENLTQPFVENREECL